MESTAAVGAAVIATATVTAAVPAPSAVKKTLNPTSDQLASLQLKEGQNTVVFRYAAAAAVAAAGLTLAVAVNAELALDAGCCLYWYTFQE